MTIEEIMDYLVENTNGNINYYIHKLITEYYNLKRKLKEELK